MSDLTENYSYEDIAGDIRRIGWAYVILHLDLNLGTLNILPDWWGYLLILSALPELARRSSSARLLKPLGLLLAVNNMVEWAAKLINFTYEPVGLLGSGSLLIGLLISAVNLYFHFQLLTDIANVAGMTAYDGETGILHTRTWYTVLMTVLQLLVYLPFIPSFVPIILLLVNLVVAIIICRQILRFGSWLRKDPDEPEEI